MTTVYKTDDGSHLRFHYESANNAFQSAQHGRPVYDKVLMVEVLAPGSRDSIPDLEVIRWVTEDINTDTGEVKVRERQNALVYERYKRQIKDFMDDIGDPDLAGTPIEQWPGISVETVGTLKEARILTVDSLAALPDSRLPILGPGGRALREKAAAFMEAAKGNAPLSALTARVADLEQDNERLQALVTQSGDVEALKERADKLEEENKKLRSKLATAEADLALADSKDEDKAPAKKVTKV